MNDEDLMQQFRIQVFEAYEAGRFDSVKALCEFYGMSRRWFYNWKPRWETHGPEGMRSRTPGPDEAPNALDGSIIRAILDYIKQHPSHGCDRIAWALNADVSPRTIQRYLNKWDLGTIKRRQRYHRLRNGHVLTEEELSAWASDRRQSKSRHLEVDSPGELVGMDLFYVGRIKGIGKIYQFTAVDCYSSFGMAGLAQTKSASNAIEFLETKVRPHFEKRPLRRILTDNGTEFVCRRWPNGSHPFVDHLEANGIQHTTTKYKHPWTNGHVERLQQTLLREFYQRAFQETHYESVRQLERDLEEYLEHYNFERPHQGRHNDGRVPGELFMAPSQQPALVA